MTATLYVSHSRYFRRVESVYGCDEQAWAMALELMAKAMARKLAGNESPIGSVTRE